MKNERPPQGGGGAVGDPRQDHLTSPAPPNQDPETAGPVPACCLDKRGLARFFGISVRSLDRANALGLLPAPDLVVGRSPPRFSPDTVSRLLRTRPRLPGRGRKSSR
jgi:hypothetical protein